MDSAVEAMSLELRDELASNSNRIKDTRDVRVRNFHLKAMARSPAHCRHEMLFDNDDPSIAKRLGSGVHSLILGGPELALYPGKQRRGKEFDAFAKAHPGALIFTKKEYDKSHRIADAIRGNELASRILFQPDSIYEKAIEWEWLGRSRRCTPDVRTKTHLAELKSTRNASPDKFKWDALRFGYVAQLADYANAMEFELGYAPKLVYIVAVETHPPFVVSVYSVSPRDLEFGQRQIRTWMERLLVCEAANSWPGYCQSIQDLDLPTGEGDDIVFADEDDEGAGDDD